MSLKTQERPRARRQKSAGTDDPGASVEDRIYQRIFDAIMNHRLTPGAKLPEMALCELFGVGRSVVRQALQRLAHEHMIELRPNRGAIVAIPGPEETRQIFEARRTLEVALLRLAIANATAEDHVELRAQLAAEHEAMHRVDQPSWARLASSFHMRVARLARNPILETWLKEIVSRCSLIVALYEPWGNASCEHDEHRQIVACMEKRDVEQAVKLMEDHLLELERNICLRKPEPNASLKEKLGL
jgi:DNA-binding GntR family transcriptional regulator